MYYPVFGMMHIKEPLLLIEKSSPCGGSGFPHSPYNRKYNVLSASLNKTFPSFLLEAKLKFHFSPAPAHITPKQHEEY